MSATHFPTASQPTRGIGEYELPKSQTFESMILTKKVHLIVSFLLIGVIAAAVCTPFFCDTTRTASPRVFSTRFSNYHSDNTYLLSCEKLL